MDQVPSSSRFVIVGAGVHGLSTAWHLAMALEARGTGSGRDILLLDKTGPGAGATGIACGCVRNLYMTDALHPILRHSVDVWMSDPINLGFQQVGYVSVGAANQESEYEAITRSQNAAGYPSDLFIGDEARRFLKSIWPDFVTDGVDCVLHEKPSGYAGTRQAVWGLEQKCRQQGVRIESGVEVTGYDLESGRVRKVLTSRGDVACDAVVLGLGAWGPTHWSLLGLDDRLTVRYADGTEITDKPMWTFWRLREGEVFHEPPYRDAADRDPPVLHVELMDRPVRDPASGRELQDHLYVYWKNGAERMPGQGVQGGITPVEVGTDAEIDPYGHANDRYQAEPAFADIFCASLGQLMHRFEGCRPRYHERRNGGICAFTPDNVPIFDWVRDNVYLIADSGHGFKMTGVGKLVARHLASGETVGELEPFRFDRFAAGRTFGAHNSNSPWV
ncbi:MAG: FAD-binding oxidoreductase [Geminicoccaceae bacterium]|nr:FAD-binding oxidoreductase [Geminicoccaceae bacterium]